MPRSLLLLACLALACLSTACAYPSLLAAHERSASGAVLQGGAEAPGTPRGAPGIVRVSAQPRLNLTDAQLQELVRRKTVCPFIGAAVTARQLEVFGSLDNPWTLATQIRDVANTGGGDFGDVLYNIGLVNTAGPLNPPPPSWALGYSPLALAGSVAAHAGHSQILAGPSDQPNAGRFNQSAWNRLLMRVEGGYITRTQLALWCAENNLVDPQAKPLGLVRLAKDIAYFLRTFAGALFAKHQRVQSGSKLLTAAELAPMRAGVMAALASNLFNSAAEMAFLATALHHSPRTRQTGPSGEFAVSLDDLTDLYIHRRLPKGFLDWPKNKADFQQHLGPCVKTAAKKYLSAKLKGYTIGEN